MKTIYYLTIILIAVVFLGCSKDDKDNLKTISIRYELTSSSSLFFYTIGSQSVPSLNVAYTNETLQSQTEQLLISGTSWNKTVQITTAQRPIIVWFSAAGYTLAPYGVVQIKVFVNDELKGSLVINIMTDPWINLGRFGFAGEHISVTIP